jgi:hypothetical protein
MGVTLRRKDKTDILSNRRLHAQTEQAYTGSKMKHVDFLAINKCSDDTSE